MDLKASFLGGWLLFVFYVYCCLFLLKGILKGLLEGNPKPESSPPSIREKFWGLGIGVPGVWKEAQTWRHLCKFPKAQCLRFFQAK